MILASGFGTRLYPLNVNRAKGLLEYRGKPLISHIVNKIPDNVDILVNTNKEFEADFRHWQETISREVNLRVEPVFTKEQAFGAIGSLNYWIKAENIADDLLVIASDNYFEFELSQFIAAYNGHNALVAVHDIGDKSKASQFGVVEIDGHKIVCLEEKPAKPKSTLIATACYVFPQRVFPFLSQYCSEGKRDNLGGFIAYLVERDGVYAHIFTEPWLDVGSIDVYQTIQQNTLGKA